MNTFELFYKEKSITPLKLGMFFFLFCDVNTNKSRGMKKVKKHRLHLSLGIELVYCYVVLAHEKTRKIAIRDCRPSPGLALCGVCVLVRYVINWRHK